MIGATIFRLGADVDSLMKLHRQNEALLLKHLSNSPQICQAVRFVYERMLSMMRNRDDAADPFLNADWANLVTFLLKDYYPAEDPGLLNDVNGLLRSVLKSLVDRIGNGVSEQVTALCTAVSSAAALARRCNPSRILLVELPVGNSLPCKLLLKVLASLGLNAEVIRVSLSRNDKQRIGVTRSHLLAQGLAQANLKQSDLVIYLDEWMTGSNFYTISRIISNIARKADAAFAPLAMLMEKSHSMERFTTRFAPQHDKLCEAIGMTGSECRFTFPTIKAIGTSPAYFFWGEHDRTAGYRKMQFLGTLFSSIDSTIEHLHSSTDGVMRAKLAVLTDISRNSQGDPEVETKLRVLASKSNRLFEVLFEESYQDYLLCRDQISNISHSSNNGLAVDADDSLFELTTLVGNIVKNRSAHLCVSAALIAVGDSVVPDIHDRYYFEGHVPVIYDLEGDFRLLHEYWMEYLETQYSLLNKSS